MVGMEEMGEFLNGKGLRREAEQGMDDDFHTRCVLLNPISFSDCLHMPLSSARKVQVCIRRIFNFRTNPIVILKPLSIHGFNRYLCIVKFVIIKPKQIYCAILFSPAAM